MENHKLILSMSGNFIPGKKYGYYIEEEWATLHKNELEFLFEARTIGK